MDADSMTVLFVAIGVYSLFRLVGQGTPDRAGARPYHLERVSPHLDQFSFCKNSRTRALKN